MSSIRRDNKATCASGLPVSVADEPYFAMISFFTSGVNAMSFPFHFSLTDQEAFRFESRKIDNLVGQREF
jgi:hypothetical protein